MTTGCIKGVELAIVSVNIDHVIRHCRRGTDSTINEEGPEGLAIMVTGSIKGVEPVIIRANVDHTIRHRWRLDMVSNSEGPGLYDVGYILSIEDPFVRIGVRMGRIKAKLYAVLSDPIPVGLGRRGKCLLLLCNDKPGCSTSTQEERQTEEYNKCLATAIQGGASL